MSIPVLPDASLKNSKSSVAFAPTFAKLLNACTLSNITSEARPKVCKNFPDIPPVKAPSSYSPRVMPSIPPAAALVVIFIASKLSCKNSPPSSTSKICFLNLLSAPTTPPVSSFTAPNPVSPFNRSCISSKVCSEAGPFRLSTAAMILSS